LGNCRSRSSDIGVCPTQSNLGDVLLTTAIESIIARIDAEYDRDDGFIGRLRSGIYDPDGANRLLTVLNEIELGDGPINRRLVSLLWFMPLIVGWQKPRLQARDAELVEGLLNQIVNILQRVLGVP
jgi:hypothetical protein